MSEVPRHYTVQPGDHHLRVVAEKHGLDVHELAKRNETALRNAAQQRGFDQHVVVRRERDHRGVATETGEVDYHVFPGEVLELRDPEEHEPGHPNFQAG